ncbi:MAG: GTPase Era [Lachnospiraceae bacterium]|nr:GTPase Era [Lachnospiraceae bacterium]
MTDQENKAAKSGFVTIVGLPNAGKSTLLNSLVGQKIAITSKKPQTTRGAIRGILNEPEGQIVFVDTPGVNKPADKLDDYMQSEVENSLKGIDAMLLVIDIRRKGPRADALIERLKSTSVPLILVLNKVDSLSREKVFEAINYYRLKADFADIVPVSAKTGRNTDELVKVIFSHLPEGPAYYDEETITDQTERKLVCEIIREKALYSLNEEIPYGLAVVVDRMEYGRRLVKIDATIICERDSHKKILIGKGGDMLREIGSNARYEIQKMLGRKVFLKLWVKVSKKWRESDYLLKDYGYDKSARD